MQTATEMLQEDGARRMRAAQYESWLGHRASLQTRVSRLEGIDYTEALRYLEVVAKGASCVPASLLTRSLGNTNDWRGQNAVMPGGFVVAELLASAAARALTDLRVKDQERVVALEQARTDLKRVEKEIKQFEK